MKLSLIPMTNQFVPHKPEKRKKFELTGKEIHLVECLRKVSFGKVVVHKANGTLVRVENVESILLDEEKGLASKQ